MLCRFVLCHLTLCCVVLCCVVSCRLDSLPISFFVATICNLLTKVCSYNTFETRAFKPNPTDYLDSKLVTIQSTFIQWKTLFLGQHNTTSASRSYIDQLSKFWVHCFKMLKNFTFQSVKFFLLKIA